MPALTVDTDPSSSPPQASYSQPHSPHSRSRSSSPIRPPYSPITPVLAPARFPSNAANGNTNLSQNANTNLNSTTTNSAILPPSTTPRVPQRAYTHTQQPQTFIPPPPAPTETISLDENPDAIAVRSAISILQLQRQKAIADIQALEKIKERALADPQAFAAAVASGEVKSKEDPLFGAPGALLDDADDDDEDEEEAERPGKRGKPKTSRGAKGVAKQQWPSFPAPQNVVRTPPINWTQYGVVGESLDKLHADQVARPLDGLPAKIGPQGQVTSVEGGPRRAEPFPVAAPYSPLKDKIDKGGGKKGGGSKK